MQYVLFGSWVGILLFTWLQISVKDKRPLHYCMIIGCLCLTYMLMYFWALEAGLIRFVPALALSDISVIILAIPAFYLASLSILYEGKRPVRSYPVYFAVFAPIALIAGSITVPVSISHFMEHGTIPNRMEHPVLGPIFFTTYLLFSLIIVRNLFEAFRLYRTGRTELTHPFVKQVIVLFLYLPASCLLWLSFIFRNERMTSWGASAIGLIALGFAFAHMSVSFITQRLTPSRSRTVSRPEWDRTATELSARLAALMKTEEPYRDPDLTLPRLAKLLEVDQKRLSYLFNVTLSKNFRSYINEQRLRAVCRELVEQPERSILDTAFANGFNSKSSFNTLFIKAYGKTPRTFRKECTEKRTTDQV